MNSKDISFEKQLQIAEKKSVLSTTQVNYLISDMNRFSKYMKKIKDKNPSISSKELENKILDDFHYNLTPIIFESGFSFENYMDLNSCKFFQEHANAFDDIWKIVSSPDYEPPATNETFGDYLESYLYNIYKKKNDIYSYALYNFDSYMKSVLEDVSFSDDPDESVQIKFKKLEKYIKANYSSGLAQKELMNDLKIACLSPRYYLKVDQKYLEEDIRKELTSSIVAITSTLKETGAYANYEKVNDRNLRKFQFPEFQKNSAGLNLYTDLKELPNSLNNLSIDDLMILNTFWLNRYVKELNAYSDCISAIRENPELHSKVFSEDPIYEVFSAEELKPIIIKKAILRPLITDFILKKEQELLESDTPSNEPSNPDFKQSTSTVPKSLEQQALELEARFSNCSKPFIEEDNNDKYVCFSYEPLKDLVSDYEFVDNYKDYFQDLIPGSKNDPREDIIFYAKLFNPSIAAYAQKSDYLSALIINVESNPQIINAGIIPDSYSDDKSHVNLGRFVGLGIDANLTYPVREHVSLNFLKDFAISYQGSSILPIYEGADDFKDPINTYDSSFVSAQLVLPFSVKQSELLKKIIKSNGYSKYNKNFIQHMYFLKNSKRLPDSFLTEKISPNGKVKKVFERKYVDLETGQIYTMDKDGKYHKVEPSKEKENVNDKELDNYDR